TNDVAVDPFDNSGVNSIVEKEGGLLKCKICGVKFESQDAFEGHIAAGHSGTSDPYEPRPSGLGNMSKTLFTCEVCGRGFPSREEYETHRLQH
ncbi:MAG TPA: C2H2-type zinc finger protein, partial [Nitrososphaera sp.]|nr:C2H2-type zinc finger protein [Nitrososphaera sp.]